MKQRLASSVALANDDLKNELIAEFEKTLGKKPLPALMRTREIERLGVRSKDSLDADSCRGIGLLPISNGERGKSRLYLTSRVIDFALGGA